MDLVDRFVKKYEIADDGCWNWTAARQDTGYGWFGVGGKNKRAHRVAWELAVGPIPEGLTIDHLCRNTSCVNPDHLEPVTMGENVLRGFAAPWWQSQKTHCPQGHEYTEENTSRTEGHRRCRECLRQRARRWRASHR